MFPGRMDMHVHMPYRTFPAFKQLAGRYFCFYDLKLFGEIRGIPETVDVTHAEIVWELTKSADSFQGVAEFLREKKLEKDEKLRLQRNKRGEEEHQEERFW
ncbi:hypothetical protein NC652_004033 [Populus alba x Populus x berolinensis]|uniref:AAA+ ATPase At3g28540-like C-terminal domain-containing protein n=1 Tax=Populus tomentosa TaxID=118781 RepID=A0A8X8J057_POPTO|nr:hypothetical protein POTOM_003012 [Populus tomentosa]KAJ6966345.1 hypothetical protein NC652_004033 [Populus alba x Populus x berolinensis]